MSRVKFLFILSTRKCYAIAMMQQLLLNKILITIYKTFFHTLLEPLHTLNNIVLLFYIRLMKQLLVDMI